ncbi:hypothetical protein IQ07DRAFT_597074 [Pyrenochaeta sp. DS3sAY3a]|nr:hypothetical protein IQ07DRAFT_597074 [Pyrenochaeta sp. DS3sAY3a]
MRKPQVLVDNKHPWQKHGVWRDEPSSRRQDAADTFTARESDENPTWDNLVRNCGLDNDTSGSTLPRGRFAPHGDVQASTSAVCRDAEARPRKRLLGGQLAAQKFEGGTHVAAPSWQATSVRRVRTRGLVGAALGACCGSGEG